VLSNVITGFREHFRQLATLDPEMDIDNKYHNMVEEEIKIINEIVAEKNIPLMIVSTILLITGSTVMSL
jgi:hypothetical protein